MPEITVVLVEPKIEGNVGAVARTMKNFGLGDLRLVRSCELGDEAFKRAKHARDLLENAESYESLEDATKDCSLVVGTSGIDTPSEKKFVRIAMNPRDLSAKLENHEGRAAVLFGREDLGLFNEELLKCDMLVKIPTSEAYPILNISHAASIVFYELFSAKVEKRPVREVTDLEREKLNEFFRMLLLATDHPRHTMERTEVMFRRLIGRAVLSEWEYHILMGVLGDAVNRIKHKQG